MTYRYPLGLFAGFGVELEYMIVDRQSLDVRPVADALFRAAAGVDTCDVEPDGPEGAVGWSNELALHVVELKTIAPVATLDGLAPRFDDHVRRVDALLEPMGARLMPGGMHPWMDPDRETRLWPHENNDIYATYDRIFGCRGHGWGNLQSTHLNLSFGDDAEFGRLHAAIRLVLALLPALAASSPFVEGAPSARADHRLEVYRTNAIRVPLMTGDVIPEPVFTRADYERQVLGALYDALRPLDPEGLLRYEWANARGCIPRFDRGSIEVRVLDIQECPAADLALLQLVVAVIRGLLEERWISYAAQREVPTAALAQTILATVHDAERAAIEDPIVRRAFDLDCAAGTAGAAWRALLERVLPDHPSATAIANRILEAGSLSTRLRRAAGSETPDRDRLRAVHRELADCLHQGCLFRA